jgi:hypothetical protein
MNEVEPQSKKTLWIIIAAIVVLILLGVLFFMTAKKDSADGSRTFFGNLFGSGQESEDTPRGGIEAGEGEETGEETGATQEQTQLFRQLANIPVAGGVAIVRDGKPFVRYVARETGHVFEVDPSDAATVELTNTTIPRVYEALWLHGGNSVVLRYLTQDPLSLKDIIKTYLAHLDLPIASTSSDITMLGSLKGEFLPDNISAVSLSPDGKLLFYLLPVSDGVSGTTVTLRTMAAKEVLRHPFSEWLPQIMNDGSIILTTKPSANVHGFAYLYTPINKKLTRLIREKNALTTNGEAQGTRILYGQNVSGNTVLSLYDKVGFGSEEGVIAHEAAIPLATLPEKCAWSTQGMRIYCGAFSTTPRAQIPDEWYQGVLSFDDTFWRVQSNTSEISFIADPTKQPETNGQSFDVFAPFIALSEEYFYFVNKKDSTLWSMVIENTLDETQADVVPVVSPEEASDAAGSTR